MNGRSLILNFHVQKPVGYSSLLCAVIPLRKIKYKRSSQLPNQKYKINGIVFELFEEMPQFNLCKSANCSCMLAQLQVEN